MPMHTDLTYADANTEKYIFFQTYADKRKWVDRYRYEFQKLLDTVADTVTDARN